MVIEIRGVGFVNKGAELMLLAIHDQITKRYPEAILAMEKTSKTSRRGQKEMGILTVMNFQRFKINWSRWGRFLPKKVRKRLGYVLESEIDIILDASGFAYGDQWSIKSVNNRLGSRIDKWRREHKKLIFLPQAFGPFKNEIIKDMMVKAIENCDLIFAREDHSYQFLLDIKNSSKIRKAPDFTNVLHGRILKDPGKYGDVAIIPNYKMVRHSGEAVYFSFLKMTILTLCEEGFSPYFLIHEGDRDNEIAQRVNQMLDKELDIARPKDPLLIKGMINEATFIVSSRFHGVVSALSQGIPCIITSWSHKYELLAEEYQVEDFVIKDPANSGQVEHIVKMLRIEKDLVIIKNRILERSTFYKELTFQMWNSVFTAIEK